MDFDEMKALVIKSGVVIVTCHECGYEYEVKPATARPSDEGWICIYGSRVDFCDRCDTILNDSNVKLKYGEENHAEKDSQQEESKD